MAEPPPTLLPFQHQVGGHTGLFLTRDALVCKPSTASSRESDFYRSLPPCFTSFTPEFKGVEEFEGKGQGLSGHPSESNEDRRWEDSKRVLHPGNPWGIKCQTSTLSSLANSPRRAHSFLLMENLVRHYENPCILDLKVGTQQHGDDASEQKKRSQIRKCKFTTSSALGLRLCGMQIYDPSSDRFLCTDKYEGRTLSSEDLVRKIADFAAASPRPQAFKTAILRKLRELLKVIERADGFRFYSSSLLLAFDPAPSLPYSLHMVDFEHSTFKGFRDDPVHSGPDPGYTHGLRSLIAIFSDSLLVNE